MATAILLPPPRATFFDALGNPLAGGLVHTYVPSTTTPALTWQDSGQVTPNSNPIVLDADGSCLLYGNGNYQITVTDALGNAIPTYSGLSASPGLGFLNITAMAPVVTASTLDSARQLMGVNRAGQVLMMPVQPRTVPATWLVYLPDGTLLNTTGSTTSGLQEAINYVCKYGYDFEVYGGTCAPSSFPGPYNPAGSPGNDYTILNFATPIYVPPLEKGSWKFGAVSFNYTGAASSVAWTWDSAEIFTLDSQGAQFVASTTAIIMTWLPTNPWPIDTFGPAVASSTWRMGPIAQLSTGPCARLDATNGPITHSTFHFEELNGGTCGLQLLGGIHGVDANIITCAFIHINSSYGISIGLSAADQLTVAGNFIDVTMDEGAGSDGISCYGSNNIIKGSILAVGASLPLYGLVWQTSAQNNIFHMGNNFASTPVQDLSNRSNAVYTGIIAAQVNRNGGAQNFATATFAKVQFGTIVIDTAGAFSVSNNRWTPGIPGFARISASISWTTAIGVGTFASLAIYRNGTVVYEVQVSGVSAPTTQTISALVSIANSTDYFEIWAYQNTGALIGIDGNVVNTWATFERLY